MKVLVYKRTHTGDPSENGVFGESDCMGAIRNWYYDAVIGIGSIRSWEGDEGIAGKVTWICKPPPPFALCYINFCTRCVLKVTSAFALYRIAEYKKSDGNVAFVFTSYK